MSKMKSVKTECHGGYCNNKQYKITECFYLQTTAQETSIVYTDFSFHLSHEYHAHISVRA